jgi:hypothetical protein
MIMSFPAWAPPKLVDIYKNQYESRELREFRDRERANLLALITDPEMERVWKMLYSKRKSYPIDSNEPKSYGDGVMAHFLFVDINRAFVETKRKITTKNDDALQYLEIAKAARSLAGKLRSSSLDLSPLHWFPIEAINTMLEKDINPEKAAGFFCLASDESDFHKKGGIYEEVRYTDKKSGKIISEYRRTMAGNTNEFFNRYMITPQYPSLSEILKSVADEANEAAKHESTRPRIVGKATISTTTIFIRALYPFWLETFGGPLYRTFAALCRVVLDDSSIDENNIKDALRNYKIPT